MKKRIRKVRKTIIVLCVFASILSVGMVMSAGGPFTPQVVVDFEGGIQAVNVEVDKTKIDWGSIAPGDSALKQGCIKISHNYAGGATGSMWIEDLPEGAFINITLAGHVIDDDTGVTVIESFGGKLVDYYKNYYTIFISNVPNNSTISFYIHAYAGYPSENISLANAEIMMNIIPLNYPGLG